MTLSSGLSALIAAFWLVALRSIQQQNIIHSFYGWAIGTSYAIAFADIAIVLSVVHMGWASVPWIGTGGALGVTFAMYVHKRFIQKNGK